MRYILLVVFIFININLLVCQSDTYIEQGNKLLKKEDYSGALSMFNTAINKDPNNSKAFFGRGKAYLKLNNLENAEMDLTEYLNRDDSQDGHLWMGFLYEAKEEYKKAIKEFEASSLYDNIVYKHIGFCFYKLFDYKKAIFNFDFAIRENKEDGFSYYKRGECYKELNELDKACDNWRLARLYNINVDEEMTTYCTVNSEFIEKATIYYDEGKKLMDNSYYQTAITKFNLAIKMNPDYHEAYFWAASCYAKLKEYDNAILYCTKAIGINSILGYFAKRAAWYQIIATSLTYGDNDAKEKEYYDNAIKDFEIVIQNDQTIASIYDNLGWSYFDISNYDKASSNFEKAYKLNSKEFDIIIGYAVTSYRLKNKPLASKLYKEACNINPKFKSADKPVEYLQNLGYFYSLGAKTDINYMIKHYISK